MSDSLGDRMKEAENAYRIKLPRRMPVILRVDGQAFHTLTRFAERPWDARFVRGMHRVALHLVSEIAGAQIAYVQSDEVSVLVHNYKTLYTEAWFDNNLQKMVSIAASTATRVFAFIDSMNIERVGNFDCRAFILPEADVCNYFIWRQQDAVRNSIQMLAQSLHRTPAGHVDQKALNGKNTNALQEMCWQKGQNWNDVPTHLKRGAVVHKDRTIDLDPPTFTADREYINRHLAVESS